jgi:hypothetical protein
VLKKFLTTPPVLNPPHRATSDQPAKDLLLYISYTTHVVSTALVVERAEEGRVYLVQHPVYFISEVLDPSKIRYPQVQKLLYVVLLTARKLRHYFDDHKAIVVTRLPIGDNSTIRKSLEEQPNGHVKSLVVISQVNKDWNCSTDSMNKYCAVLRKLEDKFEGLEFHHVERDRNAAADALSKLGSSRAQVPPGIFVQEIQQPSVTVEHAEGCNALDQAETDLNDWREPIIRYIKNEEE